MNDLLRHWLSSTVWAVFKSQENWFSSTPRRPAGGGCVCGMEKGGYGRRRRPQFLSWWLTELIFITPISTSISRLTVTATNSFLKIKMISELSLRWFMNNGHDTAGSRNRHVVNTKEKYRSAPSEERWEPSQNWLSSTPDLVRQFSEFFDKLT